MLLLLLFPFFMLQLLFIPLPTIITQLFLFPRNLLFFSCKVPQPLSTSLFPYRIPQQYVWTRVLNVKRTRMFVLSLSRHYITFQELWKRLFGHFSSKFLHQFLAFQEFHSCWLDGKRPQTICYNCSLFFPLQQKLAQLLVLPTPAQNK